MESMVSTGDCRSTMDFWRVVAGVLLFAAIAPGASNDYFVVRVTDQETGRGVPLVKLKLPNEVQYWTDSAGIAALREPAFAAHAVFVAVSAHGYEFPQETFLGRG